MKPWSMPPHSRECLINCQGPSGPPCFPQPGPEMSYLLSGKVSLWVMFLLSENNSKHGVRTAAGFIHVCSSHRPGEGRKRREFYVFFLKCKRSTKQPVSSSTLKNQETETASKKQKLPPYSVLVSLTGKGTNFIMN